MRLFFLSYLLVSTSFFLVGCSRSDDKAENNKALEKSDSEKITSRTWCIAKMNAYNEIEISRFSFLTNGFFTVDDVLIDNDKALLVYPSIEISRKAFWLLEQDGFGDSIGLKISAFDPNAESWKNQEKNFVVLSDKKPTEQLDVNTQSLLSTEPTTNSAYPCETFSADLATKAPNRLKIEKDFRDEVQFNKKFGPYIFFPKDVKYPISLARIDKVDLSKKSWCRDDRSSSMYSMVKILSFDSSGIIKEKFLRTTTNSGIEILDASSSLSTDNWSQSTETLDILIKSTFKDPNDEFSKSIIEFDNAMEKEYGPEKAFFLEDQNGNLFYSKEREGLVNIDILSLYVDCEQFFDKTEGSFKFYNLDYTPADVNNPFTLTVQ